MKTRNGFTLIELLAVIVILAIIALIATPIILNVIETAKKGAAEASVRGYIDAVEKQIAINKLDSNKTAIPNNSYTMTELDGYSIAVKGDKPSDGWVLIEKGRVTDYSLKIGDYVVNPDSNKAKAEKNGTLREKPAGDTIVKNVIPTLTKRDGNNQNDAIEMGDLITIDTELFRVVKTSGEDILMLANSNIDFETNKQTEEYPKTAFSNSEQMGDTSTTYEGSLVEKYINNYVSAFNEKYNLGVTGRAITKLELEELGCNSTTFGCMGKIEYTCSADDIYANMTEQCKGHSIGDVVEWDLGGSAQEWVYRVPFWTSTGDYLNGVQSVWVIYSSKYKPFGALSYNWSVGVRPLIIINKSKINFN